MSKYLDAAQTLERQAVKYEALMQAAAALKEIGSLEQAAAEQQAAANTARQAAVNAAAELTNLVEEIEQAKIQRAAKLKETDDIVAKAIFNANEQAAAILTMAETEAGKIKDDALHQVSAEKSVIAGQINALITNRAKLAGEITELQDRARAATADAEAAENRLAKVKESIAKLSAA